MVSPLSMIRMSDLASLRKILMAEDLPLRSFSQMSETWGWVRANSQTRSSVPSVQALETTMISAISTVVSSCSDKALSRLMILPASL